MTTTPQPFYIGERNLPNPEKHVNPARPDNLLGASQVIAAVGPMDSRLIVMAGLAALYLAGCLAALSLLAGIWGRAL